MKLWVSSARGDHTGVEGLQALSTELSFWVGPDDGLVGGDELTKRKSSVGRGHASGNRAKGWRTGVLEAMDEELEQSLDVHFHALAE